MEKRRALVTHAVTRGVDDTVLWSAPAERSGDGALAGGDVVDPAGAQRPTKAASQPPHSKKFRTSGLPWLGSILVHWQAIRLVMCSTKITNGYVGPTRDILVPDGVRYLQSLHIKKNKILFNDPYFVTEEWSREHAKSILQAGDVLIVRTGDIGQVAMVPQKFEGCNCHALIIVSPDQGKLTGEFLSWVLNSD